MCFSFLVKTLLAHDAPLRPLTEEGETPYDLAIKYNGNECAEKLGTKANDELLLLFNPT